MEDSKESRLRAEFEAWVESPPREYNTSRFPNDQDKFAWPGQYCDITVELAWESYRAASASRSEILEALEALTNSVEEVEHDCYLLHGHEHFSPREWLETARALLAKYQGE